MSVLDKHAVEKSEPRAEIYNLLSNINSSQIHVTEAYDFYDRSYSISKTPGVAPQEKVPDSPEKIMGL